MEKAGNYKVDLQGVTAQVQQHSWQVDDAFFSAVNSPVIKRGTLRADLEIKARGDEFEAHLEVSGQVEVACSRCLAPVTIPINGEIEFRVVWGEEAGDDGETITVAHDDGILDLAWQIYETAALAVPLIHTHPQGQCSEDYERYQASLRAAGPATDPRWDELKKVIKQQ